LGVDRLSGGWATSTEGSCTRAGAARSAAWYRSLRSLVTRSGPGSSGHAVLSYTEPSLIVAPCDHGRKDRLNQTDCRAARGGDVPILASREIRQTLEAQLGLEGSDPWRSPTCPAHARKNSLRKASRVAAPRPLNSRTKKSHIECSSAAIRLAPHRA